MGTEKDCLWRGGGVWVCEVFFVDCLDHATEGVCGSVVDFLDGLPIGGGDDHGVVGCQEAGEEGVEKVGGSGGGVFETSSLRTYLSLRPLLIVEVYFFHRGAGLNSHHTTPQSHSRLEVPEYRVSPPQDQRFVNSGRMASSRSE